MHNLINANKRSANCYSMCKNVSKKREKEYGSSGIVYRQLCSPYVPGQVTLHVDTLARTAGGTICSSLAAPHRLDTCPNC